MLNRKKVNPRGIEELGQLKFQINSLQQICPKLC